MNEDATAEIMDEVDDQPLEINDAEPASSPEQEEQPVKKIDGVQKRMNTLTAKRYEAERRAEELQARIAELESAKPIDTVIPEAPQLPDDMYDQAEMAKYHKDMTAYQVEIGQTTAKQAFENNQKAGQIAQQQAAQQQLISTYASNAVRDGVDMDKLRAVEQVLSQEGISPALGDYIMKDSNGGKIAEYLHDNPVVRHELLSLDVVSAGIKIATEIKSQALSSMPKVSNAPEPIPDIKGSGSLNRDDFERANPGTTFI